MIPDRILNKRIITEKGCWEYTGYRMPHGYGQMRFNGVTMLVHRVVAHLVFGIDLYDTKISVRHKCDNPPCFNPDHLKCGSQAVNMLDKMLKGNATGPSKRIVCFKGHALTEDNVFTDEKSGSRCCKICRKERYDAYNESRNS